MPCNDLSVSLIVAESQGTREVRLKTERSTPPIWFMGMSNATMGFSNGIVLFALPQLLAAEHLPEWKIAAITAVAFSPDFWSVLFAPIHVRFSRRWYASVLAAVCAISTAAAVLSLHHLVLLEIAMLFSIAAAILSSSAMGGWFSNITAHKDKNVLSHLGIKRGSRSTAQKTRSIVNLNEVFFSADRRTCFSG
jgi:MFS family permease